MPPRLDLWVDPALWRAQQDTFVASVKWLRRLRPAAPPLAGWLAAPVWLSCGARQLLMLTLAGGARGCTAAC
jgi:hypothetical protein